MRILLTISILLTVHFLSFSQNIDSLKHELTVKNDRKSTICFQIAHLYNDQFENDSAIKYFLIALENTNNTREKAKIQQDLGISYFHKNDFQKSLENFKLSLDNSILIQDDSSIAKNYSNLGVIYDYLGAYDMAIENYLKSLIIFEKLNDTQSKSKIYNNIGIIYQNRGIIDSALSYYDKALKIRQKYNSPLIEIASTYVNFGSAYESIEKYELALQNYFKALHIFKNQNNQRYFSLCLSNIAGIYYYQNKIDSSNLYLNQAIIINKNLENNLGLISSYFLKGKLFYKKYELDSAQFYLEQSLKLASSLNYSQKRIEVLYDLAVLHQTKQDYQTAYFYQNELLSAKDSFNNKQMTDKIETLKIIYETDKKEQEITNLKQNIAKKRLLLISTFLILSLLLIIFILFYKQKLTRAKIRVNEFNQKLLRLQMTPHFIFNALTSIQYYMLENDSKNAAKYLSSFSKLTRSILNNSRNELITLEEEIETIENYLKIQQLRYENKFDYKINIENDIEIEDLLIPPMLTQPFIENSIIHGFKNINYKGIITINFSVKNEKILISIKDNGSGYEIKSSSEHKSQATSITKERLKIVNKNKKKSITFKIINLSDKGEQGTKIIFCVPILTKDE
ncbi:MAG: tetratricopeptide repeat protein [Bacteroidales bacterium]|nr:tetratricopeptide repeat protein [Bacteroidales bacterium]